MRENIIKGSDLTVNNKIIKLISNNRVKKIIYILTGTFLYSVGIAVFFNPYSIAPGGIMGIAILITRIIGFDSGTWYFILNIPLIILGWKKIGSKFIILSAVSVILNTIFIKLFGLLYLFKGEILISTIIGSIFVGVGLGLILKAGASTGGMDIIVKLIRLKYPVIKTSSLFMILDITVIGILGIILSNIEIVMFSLVATLIVGKILDYILYGSDEAKLFIIITDKKEMVCTHIVNDIQISATVLNGEGAFSKKNKNLILCVVKKRTSPQLEEIIRKIDQDAFLIITRATEIYGKGYKHLDLPKM